ncbi:potassium ion channel Yvc1 [Plectosphaerella plurivora]|uniref:Potassium ion channel Yvc1 n=1 Tax=Plectosphaerella plurivora TaxID=936078 RepID=A0A9P8V674_9PEZI|nr:potassium ion channel Yvc1 [Plectosphaerella plurivora]
MHEDRRRQHRAYHSSPVLPTHQGEQLESAIPAPEVTRVALKLRHLIEAAVPCELSEEEITKAHSFVITTKVVKAAREAGGSQYRACVVFGLLVCKRWFKHQALVELWDADLYNVRAVACETIAKKLIESEDDTAFLLHNILLHRYSIMIDGEATSATNVIEKAVDLHAIEVITSSGYQKCIMYLWRGWLIQDEDDPSTFVDYRDRDNTSYRVHLDPDRIRVPRFQNATQLIISIIFLVLYTIAINTQNEDGSLDLAEILLYIFTLGFVCEELTKYWKAGYHILGFWNALNGTLYSLITVSFVFRLIGLWHPDQASDGDSEYFRRQSYNFLAFSAPLFWARLLLYLDTFRFFGAMLVVLKVMMKESFIFFALLVVLIVGFLQAFIGLDVADDNKANQYGLILKAMASAVMQSPDFDVFDSFSPPFGTILYYVFAFVVMVILLNILIALYNSAYEDIYDNANDEFMALFAQKTMQFVRAPDENVYIPPFNLVEMVVIALFEWWMPKHRFEQFNDLVMGICYSPVLVVAAWFESRTAGSIVRNRSRGEEDDDVAEEWEQTTVEVNFESDGWDKICQGAASNVEIEPAVQEVQKLRAEVDELKKLILEISKAVGAGKADDLIQFDKGGKDGGKDTAKSSQGSTVGGE